MDTIKDTTAKRFSLLELDDRPIAPAPVPTPVPTPTPALVGQVAPGARLRAPEDVARIIADHDAAVEAGFSRAETWFAVGHELIKTGEHALAESRRTFEQWPWTPEACAKLEAQVASEKRTDFRVAASALVCGADGQISRGGPALPVTAEAFGGLCRALEIPGGAAYLSAIPAGERARLLNDLHFPHAYRLDARQTEKRGRKTYVPREVQLRARVREGSPEIWAVTGPAHAGRAADVDRLAARIAEAAPKGSRCDLFYDGSRARFRVLLHSNVRPQNAGVGEIYYAGFSLTTGDGGAEAIKVASFIGEAICVNLTTVETKQAHLAQRHVGDGILGVVDEALKRAVRSVSRFEEAWSAALTENVLDRYSLDDPEDVIRGLVYSKAVWAPGTPAEELIERIKRAWDTRPGYDKVAILRAVTQAAHTEAWSSPWTVDDLEEQAGKLLYSKVWRLELPEDQTD